jgi:hypothetical protein
MLGEGKLTGKRASATRGPQGRYVLQWMIDAASVRRVQAAKWREEVRRESPWAYSLDVGLPEHWLDWLPTKDVARELGYTTSWVCRLVNKRVLRCVKNKGGHLRVDPASMQTFKAKRDTQRAMKQELKALRAERRKEMFFRFVEEERRKDNRRRGKKISINQELEWLRQA